jgi:hypothetical protein
LRSREVLLETLQKRSVVVPRAAIYQAAFCLANSTAIERVSVFIMAPLPLWARRGSRVPVKP